VNLFDDAQHSKLKREVSFSAFPTFSLIELRLDENNEGDGTLAIGVKMNYDKEKNTLVLENFSSEPVRLTRVRKTN